MKTLLAFLLLAAAAVAGHCATGTAPSGGASATVVNNLISTNGGVKRMSPFAGNNALTDMSTNVANFPGQLGASQDSMNAGAGVYLWAARTNGTGSNGWGAPIYLPGFGGTGAQYPYQPKSANVRQTTFYQLGNPHFMDRTNVINGVSSLFDTTFRMICMSPYGYSALALPTTTTNAAYNGGAIGTNGAGENVYWDEEVFGMTIGGIAREWPAGETNDAPSYVILLGGVGSTKPFAISDNHTEGSGGVRQYSYFRIVRDGLTNASAPWGSGFAMRTTNGVSHTNVNFRWGAFFDYRTGDAWVATNRSSTLYYAKGKSLSTNFGANVLGGDYYTAAVNNFNGPSAFQLPISSPWGFDGMIAGFDVANNNRLGFVSHNGQYPALEVASGAEFRIAQSGATDLLNTGSATLWTNLFVISGRQASLTNLLGLNIGSIPGQTTMPILHAGTNAVNGLTVTTNGNVGIHTNTPGATLDVHGTLATRGTITNILFSATGVTNNTGHNIRVIGVTGTSITMTVNSTNAYSLGTITVPTHMTLQPGEKLVGTSMALQGTCNSF